MPCWGSWRSSFAPVLKAHKEQLFDLQHVAQHVTELSQHSPDQVYTTGKCQEKTSQAKQLFPIINRKNVKESQAHRKDECVLTRPCGYSSQIHKSEKCYFPAFFWCILVVEMRLGGRGFSMIQGQTWWDEHPFTCYVGVQPHCQSFDPSLHHMGQINFICAERNWTKIANPWNHWRCVFQCFRMLLGRHQSAGSATQCARKS